MLLTQFFWPELRTAPTNLAAMAQDLQAAGHEVLVITGFPNHPLGRIYDGYKMRLWQWDCFKDVKILRLPLFPDHSTSAGYRALNYFSFLLSSATLGLFLSRRFRPEIIFTYFAPFTISVTATLISRFHKRIPIVYWITDLWLENVEASGFKFKPYVTKMIRKFENWSYFQAKSLCVDSPGFETNLIQKGVPKRKIHTIVEWADEDLFFPAKPDNEFAQKYSLDNKFNVVYGGNLGTVQHLSTLIYAAELVQDLKAVQFVFIGDGNDMVNLKQLVTELNLSNVRFIPRQPLHEIHRFFALANVLVVHLKKEPIFHLQLPSKIIAYMACGRPILCAVPGSAKKIVFDAQAGVSCESEDPQGIAEQVRILYQMPQDERETLGKCGRQAYLEKYTRTIQVQRIENILFQAVELGNT